MLSNLPTKKRANFLAGICLVLSLIAINVLTLVISICTLFFINKGKYGITSKLLGLGAIIELISICFSVSALSNFLDFPGGSSMLISAIGFKVLVLSAFSFAFFNLKDLDDEGSELVDGKENNPNSIELTSLTAKYQVLRYFQFLIMIFAIVGFVYVGYYLSEYGRKMSGVMTAMFIGCAFINAFMSYCMYKVVEFLFDLDKK